MDYHPRRASPLGEGWNVVSECGTVRVVNEDPEECMGLVVGIGLELRPNLGDERGRHGGEKTSLMPLSAPAHQNFTRNSQISRSWSSLHRVSSETLCRTPPTLFCSSRRTDLGNPLERTVSSVSDCERV